MRWLVAMSLLIVGLAGCADEPAPAPEGPVDENGEELQQLDAPVWSVGDWWTYQAPNNEFDLVVSEADGAYVIDTNDIDLAFFHDQFGPISYLGEQGKDDLSGSQGSDTIRFFDWPLHHNKEWTTTWDGQSFDMIAHERGEGKFHIQAMQNELVINQYVYSTTTKWFDWISFGDAEGNEVFRMDLMDRGSGYAGELLRVSASVAYELSGDGPMASSGTFTPPEGDGDLYAQVTIDCTAASAPAPYLFAIGPFENVPGIVAPGTGSNDDGLSMQGQCPGTQTYVGVIAPLSPEGTWGEGYVIPAETSIDATIWARHVERITL